jgi:hypothetical protein
MSAGPKPSKPSSGASQPNESGDANDWQLRVGDAAVDSYADTVPLPQLEEQTAEKVLDATDRGTDPYDNVKAPVASRTRRTLDDMRKLDQQLRHSSKPQKFPR